MCYVVVFKELQGETDNLERELGLHFLSLTWGCKLFCLSDTPASSPLGTWGPCCPFPFSPQSGHPFPEVHPRTHPAPTEMEGARGRPGLGRPGPPSLQGQGCGRGVTSQVGERLGPCIGGGTRVPVRGGRAQGLQQPPRPAARHLGPLSPPSQRLSPPADDSVQRHSGRRRSRTGSESSPLPPNVSSPRAPPHGRLAPCTGALELGGMALPLRRLRSQARVPTRPGHLLARGHPMWVPGRALSVTPGADARFCSLYVSLCQPGFLPFQNSRTRTHRQALTAPTRRA